METVESNVKLQLANKDYREINNLGFDVLTDLEISQVEEDFALEINDSKDEKAIKLLASIMQSALEDHKEEAV